MNTVNPDNFNQTMEGYIKRALDESKAPDEVRKYVWKGLYYAMDIMTMEEARQYALNNPLYREDD